MIEDLVEHRSVNIPYHVSLLTLPFLRNIMVNIHAVNLKYLSFNNLEKQDIRVLFLYILPKENLQQLCVLLRIYFLANLQELRVYL